MNLTNTFFKYLCMPVCRTYFRHILGNRPADKVITSMSSLYFWYRHNYWPNFKNPQTFSEKVWNRMLYNRDPLLTRISDKLTVRGFVSDKIGSHYLIPNLWQGDKPEDIPFDDLPEKFVIKTNHGCGYNIIVQDKMKLDKEKTRQELRAWLRQNFCQDRHFGLSWAYKNIKPYIIVEAFIGQNGKPPIDYKFFCYRGRAEFVQVSYDRFGDPSERLLDRDFRPLDVWNGLKLYQGEIIKPGNYDKMLCVADKLSQNFDFIRTDLYSTCNQIYFGELTCYPAGGNAPFSPMEYDSIFGKKW